MQQSVHMIMGKEEAIVIGMALSLMTEHINFDLSQEDIDSNDVMELLSMKFSTVHMMTEIAHLVAEGEKNE